MIRETDDPPEPERCFFWGSCKEREGEGFDAEACEGCYYSYYRSYAEVSRE